MTQKKLVLPAIQNNICSCIRSGDGPFFLYHDRHYYHPAQSGKNIL